MKIIKREIKMKRKELKKIILTIILVIGISIIVFLIGQYIVNKNRTYTGSMVGKYVAYSTNDEGEPNGHIDYIYLYADATCKMGDTLFGSNYNDCTYVRTDNEVVLHYFAVRTKKYINMTYTITPEGNLKMELLNDTYYRQ